MKPILEIQNIGKKYRINHQEGGYLSLRERIVDALRFERNTVEDFWALKDVSFDVKEGESIGIIGRNGAGKSTLLKILSKITPPTTGRIVSRGRIASLLEVGTGFHPELTGRENIFFNGSLLGMKRNEIALKFDEIVEFSGVEKFLDTPLKHYSSGMQLRLAFAVAAFLESEILIIDEVLAVGDAEFQKKCINKMADVKREGRTFLFVSHNMMIVENLCTKGILLNAGLIERIGTATDVVKEYLAKDSSVNRKSATLVTSVRRQGTKKVLFKSVVVKSSQGEGISIGDTLDITLSLTNDHLPAGKTLYLAFTIFNQHGVKLVTLDNLHSEEPVVTHAGEFKVKCVVPNIRLMPSDYRVELWCGDSHETFDLIEDALTISITSANIFGTGKIHNEAKHGNFVIENHWANDSD